MVGEKGKEAEGKGAEAPNSHGYATEKWLVQSENRDDVPVLHYSPPCCGYFATHYEVSFDSSFFFQCSCVYIS